MTFIMDKDEGTAARRRVPFRVFLSNGTAPDTGVSNDTVMLSINGAAQLSAGSASAISAAAGMYYVELTQSLCSVLGSHPVWYDLGDFAQHVATVQVVNSNPFSTQSNVTAVGVSGINGGSYSGVTIQGLSNYANISNVTLHAGTHSAATVQGVSNYANISNVTLHAGTHSAATVQGVSNYANISNVTLHAGTHSGATIQGLTRINSSVTIADGTYSAVTTRVAGIVAASFEAGAIDALALATDAVTEIADGFLDRNMATGTDSGTSAIRTPRNALRTPRNRVASDATQLYVYGEDDTTIVWTASLATVASTANHVSGFDPNS